MKKKITGIISFICAIGWLIALIIIIITNVQGDYDFEIEKKLIIAAMFIFTLSTSLYILWTNFGNRKKTEIEIIDYENQILRMKIEQKELKIKLES